MPLDAICLSGVTRELKEKLTGAKIDRIQQPERDMDPVHAALKRARTCAFSVRSARATRASI